MNALLTWELALFASFLIAREPVALRISWAEREAQRSQPSHKEDLP